MLLNKENTAITQKKNYGANTRSELHRLEASSKCVRVVVGEAIYIGLYGNTQGREFKRIKNPRTRQSKRIRKEEITIYFQ